MARGWESKAVEEQINAREAKLDNRKRTPTHEEMQRRVKREGLLLARVRTVTAIQSARDERYRQQLERALAHLDAQLSES